MSQNRIIKIRVWDGYNEKWENREVFISKTGSAYLFNNNSMMLEPLNENYFKLQQFTGLTDSTGKEIYEGDIVKVNNYHIVKIECENLYCGCQFITKQGNYLFIHGGLKLKIIGNIFENPDLIK